MKPQLPVDETVKMPAAVRAQVARIEAAYSKTPSSVEPAPESQHEPTPAAAQVPADSPAKDVLAAAPVTPVPQPEPAPASAPASPASVVDWEQKYRSERGRSVRAQEVIGSLRDRISELETSVASLQRAEPPRAPTAQERLITDKERDEYGQELLDVVGRRAKEELNPLFSSLERRIDELSGTVQRTSKQLVQNTRENLFVTLDDKCPQWRELNESEEFIDWLHLRDRFSGAIRQELLNVAYEQNDAPRVLAFFQGFLQEAATVPAQRAEPELTPPAAVLPGTTPAADKIPLEAFAAPGRAKSTAAPAPVEKPTITRSQIAAFYSAIAAGRYRGKEAEKEAAEKMIFEAERDGRIL